MYIDDMIEIGPLESMVTKKNADARYPCDQNS